MHKKFKLTLGLIIGFLSLLSLFLAFSLKGIFIQAKEEGIQAVANSSFDQGEAESVLAGLQDLNVGFSIQGPTDFEWQYSDGRDLKRFNVAGVGVSVENARLDLSFMKRYFEEKDFFLDQDNDISGLASGLYGYYREDLACLVSGVNSDFDPNDFSKELTGDTYDIEVQCGQLSEQDVLRLSGAKENSKLIDEESEVMAIVKTYLAKTFDFASSTEYRVDFLTIKKNECPGCWSVELSYPSGETESGLASSTVRKTYELNDWAVIESVADSLIEDGETVEQCTDEVGLGPISNPELCTESKD